MLPSEKAELWMRRLLYALLIAIVLYLVVWMTRFIWGVSHRVLQQRQPPPEACLHPGCGVASLGSTRDGPQPFDRLRVAPLAPAGRTPSAAEGQPPRS
jgi:hypothetical protein